MNKSVESQIKEKYPIGRLYSLTKEFSYIKQPLLLLQIKIKKIINPKRTIYSLIFLEHDRKIYFSDYAEWFLSNNCDISILK